MPVSASITASIRLLNLAHASFHGVPRNNLKPLLNAVDQMALGVVGSAACGFLNNAPSKIIHRITIRGVKGADIAAGVVVKII